MSPLGKHQKFGLPFHLLDGTLLFKNWQTLVNNEYEKSPVRPINSTEVGGDVEEACVRTNTASDAGPFNDGKAACQEFTSNDNERTAFGGSTSAKAVEKARSAWTIDRTPLSCAKYCRIYCFEN
jgi:hypothetical protein